MTKSEIMTRAHAWTRETVAAYPGSSYRATLAAALHELWKDIRSEDARSAAAVRLTVAAVLQAAEDAVTRRTADTAAAAHACCSEQQTGSEQQQEQEPATLAEFLQQPGDVQLETLRKFAARCPGYAARQVKKTTDPETGETVTVPAPAAWADWMIPRSRGGLELEPWSVAVDTIAAEAWTRLEKQPEDLPLQIILARAARAACMRLSKVYRDAPNNRSRSRRQDGSGTIIDAVSLDDPDYSAAAHFPGPESATVTREAIRQAANDPRDFAILDLRSQGQTLQQIAARLGISHPAVIKRLRRMKERTEDAKTEQAANDLDAAVMAAAGQSYRPRKTWRPDNASSSTGGRENAAQPRSAAATVSTWAGK